MIARFIAAAAALAATPALAASGPFFSLRNTDFIVTLAFLVFVGVLLYFRVPAAVGKLLDKRAEGIKADVGQARRLRDEAQDIYASYERRQREVRGQADEIVANEEVRRLYDIEMPRVDEGRFAEAIAALTGVSEVYSVTGAIEVRRRAGASVELNAALHSLQ